MNATNLRRTEQAILGKIPLIRVWSAVSTTPTPQSTKQNRTPNPPCPLISICKLFNEKECHQVSPMLANCAISQTLPSSFTLLFNPSNTNPGPTTPSKLPQPQSRALHSLFATPSSLRARRPNMSHRLSTPSLFPNHISSAKTDRTDQNDDTSANNPSKQGGTNLVDERTHSACFLDCAAVLAAAACGWDRFALGFLGRAAADAAWRRCCFFGYVA
jgi:hypothetical protein